MTEKKKSPKPAEEVVENKSVEKKSKASESKKEKVVPGRIPGPESYPIQQVPYDIK